MSVLLGLYRIRRFGSVLGHIPVGFNETGNRIIKISYTQYMSTFSDKVKDTVVNKWGRYWQDLTKDYLDVFKDTYEHGRDYPKKTAVICSLLGFSWFCFQTNPDENNYRENVINYSNDVLLVAKPVRNPKTDQFLTSIETCHNLGLLHRLNFGLFSVLWVANYSRDLGLYQTSCSYLKPRYVTFSSRIVDIGFLGKWWRLNTIMQDYDINPDEWNVEVNSDSKDS